MTDKSKHYYTSEGTRKLPQDTDWGEGTKQAHSEWPNVDTKPRGWHKQRRDEDEIRSCFGIPQFPGEDAYQYRPYPNALVHEGPTEDRGTSHVGGTNWLAVGEKGSGKSTLGLFWAQRLMEVNDEAVVWRGSSSRSEWLPFKKWARLFVPANADLDPVWKPRDIRADTDGEPVDLEDEVREVIRYESPQDINDQLQPGTFNVVYPDPSFSGCGEIMAESDYMSQPVEWVPKWDAQEAGDATPLVHWWFAWTIAKLEYGPYDWVSLIFDETADLAPDSARADKHETYEKINALRRVMADSRKFNFSLFFLAHHEPNLHSKIRRTIQWRIDMADGTANPCQSNSDSPPLGFKSIPMIGDILSDKSVGNCLIWNDTNFNPITWNDIAEFPEDERRWLKISMSEVTPTRTRPDGHGSAGGTADD